MTHEEIIAQLESLRAHCNSKINNDETASVWMADVEALDFAIIESKRGAARAFCHKHPACSDCPLHRFRGCGRFEWANEDGLDAILKAIKEVKGSC